MPPSGFGKLKTALDFRDVLSELISKQVTSLGVTYDYTIVQSVDLVTKRAVVQYANGTQAKVAIGSVYPIVGQIVRVTGRIGDRFISDVLGSPYFPSATIDTLTAKTVTATTDAAVKEGSITRSLSRGTIGVWRQGNTNGVAITASALEVAIFSDVGSFVFVSGRRYLFLVRISGTITTASATARLIFWLKLGAGTGGTGLGEDINDINNTASAKTYKFWGEGVAGNDFAAGSSSVSITGQFSAANTFTPVAGGQPVNISAEVLVIDIST